MSEYIAKASIEPRDYRVVFLIQQKPAGISDRFSTHLGGFEPPHPPPEGGALSPEL